MIIASTAAPAIKVAHAAVAPITGNVFQDFNSDGTKDTGTAIEPAVDIGVAGVTVSAYDAAGTLVATATTSAAGDYSLSNTDTAQQYRIEFTNLPEGFHSSFHGGTSVQFARGGAADVNFAISRPADYCQNNPAMCVPAQTFGNQLTGAYANTSVVMGLNYNSSGTSWPSPTGGPLGAYAPPATLARASQVGAIFGVAYNRLTRDIYVSAMHKRFAGYGPGGPGAIYRIAPNGSVSTLITLPAGSDLARSGLAVNTVSNSGIPNAGGWLADPTWDLVGKQSIGDIDASADGSILYAMNLFDRSLYVIPAANPAGYTIHAVPTNLPGCPNPTPPGGNANVRPFGLGVYEGMVYVGIMCSAETSQATVDLRAHVYRFDPATASYSPAPVLSVNMNYTHGAPGNGGNGGNGNWHPWTPTVRYEVAYPQPILSDIAFDLGNMILGFRDRYGDQVTSDAWGGTEGVSAGDVLRACGSPTLGWTLENNGACGGIAAAPSINAAQGPGGAEYYHDDDFTNGGNHQETSMGGVAQVPGYPTMALSVFDPNQSDGGDWRSGGVVWMSNAKGTYSNYYAVYDKNDTGYSGSMSLEGRFGKANGVGDLEALCDSAPLELGNRVWHDLDGDGIQDAGEAPIGGVTVSMTLPGGAVVTTTTAADGTYYFANLTPNATYIVAINPNQPALAAYQPTQGNTNDNGSDSIDSDGVVVDGMVQTTIMMGGPGQNNHTLDFGFVQPIDLQIEKSAAAMAPATDALYRVGDLVEYTLTVRNNGPTVAQAGYTVTDLVPVGLTNLTVISAAGFSPCAFSGQTLSCTATASLPANNSLSIKYRAAIAAGASGTLKNVTWVAPAPGDLGETNPLAVPNAGTDTAATPTNNDSEAVISVLASAPALALKKYVNGADAQSAPGIFVPVGSTVVFSYVVTNAGNTELVNVTLLDDKIGAITCPKNTLSAGESMTCTASSIAVSDHYTNIGMVTANDATNLSGPALSANDPANYFGTLYDLALIKTRGGPAVVQPGSVVEFDIIVKNQGNMDSGQFELTDQLPAGMSFVSAAGTGFVCGHANGLVSCEHIAGIAPGTTAQVTLRAQISDFTRRPFRNWAEISEDSGADVDSLPDTNTGNGAEGPNDAVNNSNQIDYTAADDEDDNDFEDVDVAITPGIALKKFTNGNDADEAPGVYVTPGSTVTWTYDVRNTGNVALTNVAVTDDQLQVNPSYVSGDTNGNAQLDVNEVWQFRATGIAIAGQYRNVGTVSANNPVTPGQPLTSSDPSHYFGSAPGIAMRKFVNGVDAQTSPGPLVRAGDMVTWTYLVTNTGSVPLVDVNVSDDIEGSIVCPKNALAVSESMTCFKTGVATVGQYRNVGTVVATDGVNPRTPELTFTDPAHYFGGAPKIEIAKSGFAGREVVVRPGDVVTYTIVITNSGNLTATNVVVRDPIPSGTSYVPGSAQPQPTAVGSEVVWTFAEIGPNGVYVFTFYVVRVVTGSDSVTSIRNVAFVRTDQTPELPSNPAVNPLGPTAISLERFVAEARADGVLVSWRTALESDTLGFIVWRGSSVDHSSAVRVSDALVAARGVNGGAYNLVDSAGSAQATYWLEEVTLSGSTNWHGPTSAAGNTMAESAVNAPATQPVTAIGGVSISAGQQPVALSDVVAQPASAQQVVPGNVVVLPMQNAPAPAEATHLEHVHIPASGAARPQPAATQPDAVETQHVVPQIAPAAGQQQPAATRQSRNPQDTVKPGEPAQSIVAELNTVVAITRGSAESTPFVATQSADAKGKVTSDSGMRSGINLRAPVLAALLLLIGLSAGLAADRKRRRRIEQMTKQYSRSA